MTDKIIPNPQNTDNKITPVGLDFGNGWIKLSIGGKVAKIPACYSTEQPQGQIGKGNTRIKPQAFSLEIGSRSLWFGRDVLSVPSTRFIDERKHKSKHIRALFAAAMYNWSKMHKTPLASLGRLRIVAGIPAQSYEDKAAQARAIKAYKTAFTLKNHWYVRPDKTDKSLR